MRPLASHPSPFLQPFAKGGSLVKRVTIIMALALTLLLPLTSLAAEDFPRLIHLSWQNDPSTTMTIMWRSQPGAEALVEYGQDSNYTNSVTAETHSYRFGRTQVCWQIAELTGLEPDTTYNYRLKTTEPWESEAYTFKTAPMRGRESPFKFAVLSDVQGGYDNFRIALDKVKKEDVDFILYLGDFTRSSSQQEYDLWLDCGRDIFHTLPLMSVRGNVDAANYLDQFAFPGNERWFSIDYGNVHFVFLSTMLEAEVIEQRPWLHQDLEENDNPWIIAIAHKPAFGSASQNGPEQYIVDHWVDLFEEYGVDLYMNGHEHSYERTWPLKGGEINEDGVVYLTVSCAGDEYYPAVRTWLTAAAEGLPCYMVFSVQGAKLEAIAKGILDDTILDQFELELRN